MKYAAQLCGLIALQISTCMAQKNVEGKVTMARVDSVISQSKYGMVYITGDTTAEAYDWHDITSPAPFELESFDAAYVQEVETATNTPMQHVEGIDLYPYWTDLNRYKSEYYVYSPSDWMSNVTMYLTDSVLFGLSIPDPTMSLITGFKRISDGYCELTIADRNEVTEKIQIRKMDAKREVYLWRYVDQEGRTLHEAYKTPSNRVRNFKMIVNDCYDAKCYQEFDFEE